MTLYPISTGNTIAEIDSDLEHLSNMSSPTISNFSSVLASLDDASDNSTPPNLLDNVNLNGFADDSVQAEILPPLELTSFFPIIENLPGLVLEDNIYHVDGPILSTNLDVFVTYSHRVEDLLLTDLPEDDPSSKVSSSTIDRLIRIDNPESPFLSSLKRLRLANADCSLRYLVFCTTPSLEALEVVCTPLHHQITISDFLKELSHYVPQMARIALGPGLLSSSALQASLKFTHLKHLSIVDAAVSLDFAFLQEISVLPELESLFIEARDVKYNPRAPAGSADTPSDPSLTEHVRRRLDLLQGGPGLEGTDGTCRILTNSPPIPFRSLAKLTIVSTILLMGDLVYYLFPSGVREVALTLVRAGPLPIPLDWDWGSELCTQGATAMEPATSSLEPTTVHFDDSISDTNMEVEIPVSVCSNPIRIRKEKKSNVKNSGKKLPAYYFDSACQECEECLENSAKLKQEKSKAKAEREALKRQREIENLGMQTCYFASVVQVFLEFAKPTVIYVANFDPTSLSTSDTTSKSFEFPEFPSAALYDMLLCPTLSQLEIKDWALASITSTFLDSTSHSMVISSMRSLYLPMDSKSNTGITLPTLRAIAHRYPNLLELQCPILPSSEPFSFIIDETTVKHGLEVLSVGGGSPSSEEKLAIATYLWFLFPSLKRIATHEGHNEEDWEYIQKLVRMCQVVRAAD